MQGVLLSSKIKERCKKQKISIKTLLEQCEMNRNTIYDLEHKNSFPSCDKIAQMSDVLNCSIDYLLGRTNNAYSHNPSANVSFPEEEKYVIAYFDILGTKNYINNDKQFSTNLFFIYLINDIFRLNNKTDKLKMKKIIFSDNILLAIKYDEDNLLDIIKYMTEFIARFQCYILVRDHYLLRGGLTFGNLIVNENINFVCGRGLLDAYDMEQSNPYPCVCVNKNLINSFPYKLLRPFIIEYNDQYIINYLAELNKFYDFKSDQVQINRENPAIEFIINNRDEYTIDSTIGFLNRQFLETKQNINRLKEQNAIEKEIESEQKILKKYEWALGFHNYYANNFTAPRRIGRVALSDRKPKE